MLRRIRLGMAHLLPRGALAALRALVCLLLIAQPAFAADPVTIGLTSSVGKWSNAQTSSGQTNVTGLAYSPSPQSDSHTVTNQVRYGSPTKISDKSGFGFSGRGAASSIQPGEAFLLGRFTHYNRVISTPSRPMEEVDLTVRLSLISPALTPEFTYTFTLEETPNTSRLRDCPSWRESGTPCDDRVTVKDPVPEQTFWIGGVEYTLQVVGFVATDGACPATPQGAADPTPTFITEEKKDNRACLYGRIVVATPAISIQKDPPTQTVAPGEDAEFTITVTNTGTAPLTNVQVEDPLVGDCARTIGALEVGPEHAYTYTCTDTGVTEAYTNTATATGTYGSETVTDSDTAEVVVDYQPEVSITKEASPSSVPETGGERHLHDRRHERRP